MTNLDNLLKSRDIISKGPYSQRYSFSSSYVRTWELEHKEDWVPKNWWFWTVVLKKALESPLDCKGIQPVHPKGNQSEYSLEGLMLKLKLQYFGHLMQRTDLLEKTLMLGKIEGRKRRGWQRIRWSEGITESINGHEFEQIPGDDEGHGSLVCCSPWDRKELDTTVDGTTTIL